jgi:hypothetical protein
MIGVVAGLQGVNIEKFSICITKLHSPDVSDKEEERIR